MNALNAPLTSESLTYIFLMCQLYTLFHFLLDLLIKSQIMTIAEMSEVHLCACV
jgi:hypothetical protein